MCFVQYAILLYVLRGEVRYGTQWPMSHSLWKDSRPYLLLYSPHVQNCISYTILQLYIIQRTILDTRSLRAPNYRPLACLPGPRTIDHGPWKRPCKYDFLHQQPDWKKSPSSSNALNCNAHDIGVHRDAPCPHLFHRDITIIDIIITICAQNQSVFLLKFLLLH